MALMSTIAQWVKKDAMEQDTGYLLLNLGVKNDPGSTNADWLGSTQGEMFWSSFDADTSLALIKNAGFDIAEAEIVSDWEDGRQVEFLWILARFASEKLVQGL